MSMHVLTKDAHVNRSYSRTNARIELKFVFIEFTYVDILSLKFEKDPFSGCGEINVLVVVISTNGRLCCLVILVGIRPIRIEKAE